MTTHRRPLLIVASLLAIVLATGCNIMSLPFFIFSPEPKIEPVLKKVASEDKKKTVKVVIIAYSGLETRPEFLRVDRDLSLLLAQDLKKGFEANEEKVTIVPPGKVEDYKRDHANWNTADLDEIGKHFGADYVIYLEIGSISLYQQGSGNTLYQGKVRISVSLVDVNKTDELSSVDRHEFSCQYPSETKGGAIPAGDSNPLEFRTGFYHEIAKQLSWYFTSHPQDDDYHCK